MHLIASCAKRSASHAVVNFQVLFIIMTIPSLLLIEMIIYSQVSLRSFFIIIHVVLTIRPLS